MISSLPHSHGLMFQVGNPFDPLKALEAAGMPISAFLREAMTMKPTLTEFFFGTVAGLFERDSEWEWLNLVAVTNSRSGNGHFQLLMDVLEAHENVRVLHVFGERLAKHLVEKRGYTQVPYGDDTAYERKKVQGAPGDQRERGTLEDHAGRKDDLVSAGADKQGVPPEPDRPV